jgi:DNA replication protein DnaC
VSKATLTEQIKGDLDYLKLVRTGEVFAELAEDATARGADHLEFLAAVLSAEVDATRQRRLSARLRFAHFPFRKTLEEFDFDFQPSIDPKVIYDLAELDFVREGHPVLLLGRPGCGKSHLGVALGIKAVEAGYRGYFTGATDMTKALVGAWAEGNFTHKVRTYTSPSILVIDDVGITPFDRTEANAFFQVVNRRYELRSATIVTTNRGLPAWAELFGGDSVVAAVI